TTRRMTPSSPPPVVRPSISSSPWVLQPVQDGPSESGRGAACANATTAEKHEIRTSLLRIAILRIRRFCTACRRPCFARQSPGMARSAGVAAVASRCDAQARLEQARHMCLAGKATALRHVDQRNRSAANERGGALDTNAAQACAESYAIGSAEAPRQMAAMHVERAGDLRKAQRPVVMRVEQVERALRQGGFCGHGPGVGEQCGGLPQGALQIQLADRISEVAFTFDEIGEAQ